MFLTLFTSQLTLSRTISLHFVDLYLASDILNSDVTYMWTGSGSFTVQL